MVTARGRSQVRGEERFDGDFLEKVERMMTTEFTHASLRWFLHAAVSIWSRVALPPDVAVDVQRLTRWRCLTLQDGALSVLTHFLLE